MDSQVELDEVDWAMKLSKSEQEKAILHNKHLMLVLFAEDVVEKYAHIFKAISQVNITKDYAVAIAKQLQETSEAVGDLLGLLHEISEFRDLDEEECKALMTNTMDTFLERIGQEASKKIVAHRNKYSELCAKSMALGIHRWKTAEAKEDDDNGKD